MLLAPGCTVHEHNRTNPRHCILLRSPHCQTAHRSLLCLHTESSRTWRTDNHGAAVVSTRKGAEAHLILLFVRNRIHCGMGRFCFAFFASTRLILNVFWDGCTLNTQRLLSPLKSASKTTV